MSCTGAGPLRHLHECSEVSELAQDSTKQSSFCVSWKHCNEWWVGLILEDNTRYTSLQRAAQGAYSRTNSAACFNVVTTVFVVASDGCQSVQLVLVVLPCCSSEWERKELLAPS